MHRAICAILTGLFEAREALNWLQAGQAHLAELVVERRKARVIEDGRDGGLLAQVGQNLGQFAAAGHLQKGLHAGEGAQDDEPHGGAIQPDAPFGGVKQSGIGVEFGRYGLEEYTNIQTLKIMKS